MNLRPHSPAPPLPRSLGCILAAALLLLLCGSLAAPAATEIKGILWITNVPAGLTSNLTVNAGTAVTRYWTNNASQTNSLLIQTTNTTAAARSNLLVHLVSSPIYTVGAGSPSVTVIYNATNTSALDFIAPDNTNLTITAAGTWASITYVTNTYADSVPIMNRTNAMSFRERTNAANALINFFAALGTYLPTNAIPNGLPALSNLIDRVTAQTVSNKTHRTSTNDGIVSVNSITNHGSNLVFTVFILVGDGNISGLTNLAGNMGNGALTNGSFYSNVLNYVRGTNLQAVHGTVHILSNGFYHAPTLSNAIALNLINYGSAIRSEGSGGNSFQAGSNALASGTRAVALGNGAVSSSTDGVAAGTLATNAGARGFAGGNLAYVFGDDGTAAGYNSRATNAATATGSGASATGYGSTAGGLNAVASGEASTANGAGSSATAFWASVFGAESSASAISALVLGPNGTASHSNSAAIGPPDDSGTGVSTSTTNQLMLGTSRQVVSAPGFIQGTLSNLVTAAGQTNIINGTLAFPPGTYSSISSAGAHNTLRPGSNVICRLTGSPSAEWPVGAIDGNDQTGDILIHVNETGYDAVIWSNDGSLTAGNRITTLTGTNMAWPNGSALLTYYNAASSRHVMLFPPLTVLTASATNALGSLSTNFLGGTVGQVTAALTNLTILFGTNILGLATNASGNVSIQINAVVTNQFTGTTNFIPLRPTTAKTFSTNSAYADNSLQSGFLAFPHTNGVGTVISLGATFDQLTLPSDYATNTLAFEFGVMNTATNGPNASNFVFIAEVLRHNHTGQTSTNDAQVGPFNGGTSAFTVAVAASYIGTNTVQWVSGTISNCTLAANESFSLRLLRANTNASDLVGVGVAGVTAARLRYTR